MNDDGDILTAGQLVSDAEIAALAATAGLRRGDTRLEDRLARDVRSARAALAIALDALRTIADELEADSDYTNLSEIARSVIAAVATSQGQE